MYKVLLFKSRRHLCKGSIRIVVKWLDWIPWFFYLLPRFFCLAKAHLFSHLTLLSRHSSYIRCFAVLTPVSSNEYEANKSALEVN